MTKYNPYDIIHTGRSYKTVGGLNLPPETEVSCMSVIEVLTLLILLTDIVGVLLKCNNKKR